MITKETHPASYDHQVDYKWVQENPPSKGFVMSLYKEIGLHEVYYSIIEGKGYKAKVYKPAKEGKTYRTVAEWSTGYY